MLYYKTQTVLYIFFLMNEGFLSFKAYVFLTGGTIMRRRLGHKK